MAKSMTIAALCCLAMLKGWFALREMQQHEPKQDSQQRISRTQSTDTLARRVTSGHTTMKLTSSSWPRNVAESLNSVVMARSVMTGITLGKSLRMKGDARMQVSRVYECGVFQTSKWCPSMSVWLVKCITAVDFTTSRHSPALAPRLSLT